MITENIFPIEWKLSDKLVVPYHGSKVFGTFVCGGGSTMGYKLAGYNHLGGLELLDQYSRIYKANHNPKYFFQQDIREFVDRTDLPEELYSLDLLDGSPPCAAFSTSGKREKIWGMKSKYENIRQQKDDLPFVYVKLIKKLSPKVFLLENVSGLSKGNARVYLKEIVSSLSDKYDVEVFLLFASSMGIPQLRQRTFIIGKLKKYSDITGLDLDFRCPMTTFNVTRKYWSLPVREKDNLTVTRGVHWDSLRIGERHPKHFGTRKVDPNKPVYTITTSFDRNADVLFHPYYKRVLNDEETRLLCTFPQDYNFLDVSCKNVMGRSVLPVMMANISYQIYLQWISKMNY